MSKVLYLGTETISFKKNDEVVSFDVPHFAEKKDNCYSPFRDSVYMDDALKVFISSSKPLTEIDVSINQNAWIDKVTQKPKKAINLSLIK